MKITQGTFSFLPDLTDEQIAAQIRYGIANGWALSLEFTDDPHPRHAYWEMWAPPEFDLTVDDYEVVLREVRACREAHSDKYVKLLAYDARLGRQTTAFSIIVGRPPVEARFRLVRTESTDRVQRYSLQRA